MEWLVRSVRLPLLVWVGLRLAACLQLRERPQSQGLELSLQAASLHFEGLLHCPVQVEFSPRVLPAVLSLQSVLIAG